MDLLFWLCKYRYIATAVQIRECGKTKKTNKCSLVLSSESAGARTRDPNIKSVVLYLLSYGFIVCQSDSFFLFGGANVM